MCVCECVCKCVCASHPYIKDEVEHKSNMCTCIYIHTYIFTSKYSTWIQITANRGKNVPLWVRLKAHQNNISFVMVRWWGARSRCARANAAVWDAASIVLYVCFVNHQ